jgi:hypothetical protein
VLGPIHDDPVALNHVSCTVLRIVRYVTHVLELTNYEADYESSQQTLAALQERLVERVSTELSNSFNPRSILARKQVAQINLRAICEFFWNKARRIVHHEQMAHGYVSWELYHAVVQWSLNTCDGRINDAMRQHNTGTELQPMMTMPVPVNVRAIDYIPNYLRNARFTPSRLPQWQPYNPAAYGEMTFEPAGLSIDSLNSLHRTSLLLRRSDAVCVRMIIRGMISAQR